MARNIGKKASVAMPMVAAIVKAANSAPSGAGTIRRAGRRLSDHRGGDAGEEEGERNEKEERRRADIATKGIRNGVTGSDAGGDVSMRFR